LKNEAVALAQSDPRQKRNTAMRHGGLR